MPKIKFQEPPPAKKVKKAAQSRREPGIYKRGDSWVVRFKVNGKDVRRVCGSSYEEAVLERLKIKASIMSGRFDREYAEAFKTPVASNVPPTFAEFGERFLEEYCSAPGVKASRHTYYFFGLRILNEHFGHKRMDEITRWDVEKFKSLRAKEKHPNRDGNISGTTVNRNLSMLRRIFAVAEEWGVIESGSNPCAVVKKFREMPRRVEPLTVDQCHRMIAAAKPRFRPILTILFHTGMRKSEVLNLKWSNIDLANRVIILDEAKTIRNDFQYVPIDDTVAEIFESLPKCSDFVFCPPGKKTPYKSIQSPFALAVRKSGVAEERRKAGMAPLRIHDTRHTAASLAIADGMPIEAVQSLLRHTTPAMTQRYIHFSPEYRQKVAKSLDNLLRSGTNGWHI